MIRLSKFSLALLAVTAIILFWDLIQRFNTTANNISPLSEVAQLSEVKSLRLNDEQKIELKALYDTFVQEADRKTSDAADTSTNADSSQTEQNLESTKVVLGDKVIELKAVIEEYDRVSEKKSRYAVISVSDSKAKTSEIESVSDGGNVAGFTLFIVDNRSVELRDTPDESQISEGSEQVKKLTMYKMIGNEQAPAVFNP